MKLLAFAASNSKNSINKKLVTYAASLVEGASVEVLDLNDYELPLFSVDKEAEIGSPEAAQAFLNKIKECDALLISFAEHNGSYTAAFKNLFDWCSRIDGKVYQDKPTIMLATSPGGRGGAGVLASATASGPHLGADIKGQLSIPSFNNNFDTETNTLTNNELDAELKTVVSLLND